jgi:hypothetical protein
VTTVGVMPVSRSDCLAGAKQRNELFWTEKFDSLQNAQERPLKIKYGCRRRRARVILIVVNHVTAL